jgi:Fe-S cluster biogenesis protein NfuA
MPLFLVFLSLIWLSYGYITHRRFSSALIRQQSKEINTNSFIINLSTTKAPNTFTVEDLTLGNSHLVNDLINSLASSSQLVQGVYSIEDMSENLQYVGASKDILHDIKTLAERHGNIIVHRSRVQYLENADMIEPYRVELMRQTKYQSNLLDWSVPPKLTASSKTNPKLEALKSKISAMKAQGSLTAAEVVSPFQTSPNAETTAISTNMNSDNSLEFTSANVDKILNEIRPYLIADGGNVTVVSVDEDNKDVYLQLQGACGGCPSSTVSNTTPEILVWRLSNLLPAYLDDNEDGHRAHHQGELPLCQ